VEIWPFEIFEMRCRSSVGRWSVGRQYILTFIDLVVKLCVFAAFDYVSNGLKIILVLV